MIFKKIFAFKKRKSRVQDGKKELLVRLKELEREFRAAEKKALSARLKNTADE